MKKISILLMLMALFGPLAMMGQNRATLTVYDQNTTTNEYVPIYGYYADSKSMCEFIIPNEKISAMNGGVISAMKFYLDNSSSGSYYSDISATFNVFVKEVSATTLSGLLGQSGATTVFNSTITIAKGASNVEINIPFSSNYVYGGGNLLIGVYQTATTGYNHTYWTGEAQDTNTAWGGYNGSTSAKQFLPKTTFTYTPGTTPYISLAPSSATVLTGFTTTLTATTLNVTGTPTITYTSSNTNVATVSGSGTTATVTAVAEGTATITATMTYEGTDYPATCDITVMDACQPTWTSSDYYISNFTVSNSETTLLDNSSTGTGGTTTNYYGTKSIMAEPGDALSCKITMSSSSTYGFALWVDFDQNGLDSGDLISSTSSYSSSPYTITLNIPTNASAGEYRMRIWGDYYNDSASDPCGSYSNGEAEDYKLIVSVPSCPKPTNFQMVGAPGSRSAQLSWTPGADETAWRITITGGMTDVINLTTSDLVNGVYTLGGLSPETTYNVFVQAVCGEGDNSNIVGPVTFTTDVACPAPTNVAANHVTNNTAEISFDGADNYNIRYCTIIETTYDFEDGGWSGWTYYDNDGDNRSWIVTDALGEYTSGDTYVASHGGAYYLRSTYNSSALTENWLISPQINLGGSISFYTERLGGYDDYFKVYVSTTGTSISDFTVEIQGEKEPATDYELVTIDLSSYSGNGYVAIKHYAKENDQAYIFIDDITILEPSGWQYANSHTLTGLDPETTYQVQVQADCTGNNDGTSAWVGTTFTTLDDCAVPYELEVANPIAPTSTLTWTGAQESYNVKYGILVETSTTYDFENQTIPDSWTNSTSYPWTVTSSGANSSYCAIPGNKGMNSTDSDLTFVVTGPCSISFYAKVSSESDYDYGRFFIDEERKVNISGNQDWTSYSFELAAGTHTLLWRYHKDVSTASGEDLFYVDDITITSSVVENWTTLNDKTSPLEITNLTPSTTYEWQVQGVNCDGNNTATDWSEAATFTTPEGYILHINRYTGKGDGWYLIASPIGTVNITGNESPVANLTSNTFDLYYFDQIQEPYEWINYNQGSDNNFTTLEAGKGYLYANSNDVDLIFSGTAYSGSGEVGITYSNTNSDSNMWGWNLVGNPFAVEATIGEWDYMRMNDDHNEIVVYDPINEVTVAPMEGIFVHAEETGDNQKVTFEPSSAKSATNSEAIVVNISQDQKLVDRAIVRFGEGRGLPKCQLNENSTKIYFPVDGEDFAVVRSEGIGELPVSFKAEENGNYTLSLNANGVSFGYLHLIDNMTGNDVDMLANPSYSFEARTSDYSHRFKLVFATGDNANDTFAYFSNGSFVINNDGKATLQVIDITGRILKSESINGCANLNFNAAPGVYMIRLINGTDVKVQKVVVK